MMGGDKLFSDGHMNQIVFLTRHFFFSLVQPGHFVL